MSENDPGGCVRCYWKNTGISAVNWELLGLKGASDCVRYIELVGAYIQALRCWHIGKLLWWEYFS